MKIFNKLDHFLYTICNLDYKITLRKYISELLTSLEMKNFINKLIDLSDYSLDQKQQIRTYFNPQSIGGKKKIYNRI